MYATMWCPYCQRARKLFEARGVAFEERDVDGAAGLRAEMREKSGGRTSVPQIFIGATHVGGYDDLRALDERGELERLLGRG
jgi:glutaredoxin 3